MSRTSAFTASMQLSRPSRRRTRSPDHVSETWAGISPRAIRSTQAAAVESGPITASSAAFTSATISPNRPWCREASARTDRRPSTAACARPWASVASAWKASMQASRPPASRPSSPGNRPPILSGISPRPSRSAHEAASRSGSASPFCVSWSAAKAFARCSLARTSAFRPSFKRSSSPAHAPVTGGGASPAARRREHSVASAMGPHSASAIRFSASSAGRSSSPAREGSARTRSWPPHMPSARARASAASPAWLRTTVPAAAQPSARIAAAATRPAAARAIAGTERSPTTATAAAPAAARANEPTSLVRALRRRRMEVPFSATPWSTLRAREGRADPGLRGDGIGQIATPARPRRATSAAAMCPSPGRFLARYGSAGRLSTRPHPRGHSPRSAMGGMAGPGSAWTRGRASSPRPPRPRNAGSPCAIGLSGEAGCLVTEGDEAAHVLAVKWLEAARAGRSRPAVPRHPVIGTEGLGRTVYRRVHRVRRMRFGCVRMSARHRRMALGGEHAPLG